METQEESRNTPRFKGRATEVDALDFVSAFSEDGQAVTILFSNLYVEVGGRRDSLVTTRTVSISIPLESNDQDMHLTQSISGFVSIDGAARAVLLIQAAGGTTLVDLHEAKSEAKERTGGHAKDLAEDGKLNDDSFDFLQIIESELSAGANYQITFFLLVERDVADAADVADVATGAMLTIDSLDIEVSNLGEKK